MLECVEKWLVGSIRACAMGCGRGRRLTTTRPDARLSPILDSMLDSAAVQDNLRAVSSAPGPPRGASTIATVGWTLVILAALYVGYFSHLGGLGFVGPDEPRYAWVAREMVETGDWVTPRLYGKPWFEKPVLYYWGAAVAFKLFGVSEAAARLPSAISALLATIALAWLAWRKYGAETARFLLMMLPTTIAMIAFSHAAAPDMLFTAMLTVAMAAAIVVVGPKELPASTRPTSHARETRAAIFAFGFFLGAATLAKGPAAIILTGGAASLWVLTTQRWRDALRLAHPIAIGAFWVTALPWYVLCAFRNPDFLRVFILEHNFARFLTPLFQHEQPFWFFVPVILLGAFPWTLAFALAGRDIFRRWRAGAIFQSSLWFVGCWAIVPIIFFSLSKSKLPGYVLPSFPALVYLLSRSVCQANSNKLLSARWLVFAQAVMFVALGIAARVLQSRVAGGIGGASVPWKIQFIYAAILGGIAIGCLGLWRATSGPIATSILMLILTGILMRGLVQLDSIYFSRDAANFASAIYPALTSESAFVYRVQRAQQYSLSFYFHRELSEWSLQQKSGLVFTPLKGRPVLEGLGLHCNQRPDAVSTSLIVCVRP